MEVLKVDIADENPTFHYVSAGGANNVIVGLNFRIIPKGE